MSECLMINDILNAVTKQLGDIFGASYRYYVEDVEQKLTTPCFTIDTISPTVRSKSPILYDWSVPLVIHYFSDKKPDLKKDCYSVCDKLVECLEYLPFGDTFLRGEDISFGLDDDVLQVFLTYRFAARRLSEDVDNIEEYEGLTTTIE